MNPIKQMKTSMARRQAAATSWCWAMASVLGAILVALAAASTLVEASPSPQISAISDGQQQVSGINNLENLISDFLEEAGSRLKKSKVNSMRQIKQTLRFGRRSDPMMSGAALLEQLALENELENQQQNY